MDEEVDTVDEQVARKPWSALMLTDLRKSLGLSSEDFADILGVAATTYRKAESGRSAPSVFRSLRDEFPVDSRFVLAVWRVEQADQESAAAVDLEPQLVDGLLAGGLSRFFPSRAYYRKFRDGRQSISDYVSKAQHCLEMVSINLATGHGIEGFVETLERIMFERRDLKVRISLLDPTRPFLMESIAPVIDSSPEVLAGHIQDTTRSLLRFQEQRLTPSLRSNFQLWHHQCLPNASAIIIDADGDLGSIQLETKGYRTGMRKSWGFEVRAGSEFFITLRESYRQLIEDGVRQNV